jgi:hypothetical protein
MLIALATMKEIANSLEKEERIKKGNEWLYFHTPNHPFDKVKTATFGSQGGADCSIAHQVLCEHEIAAMEAAKEQQWNDILFAYLGYIGGQPNNYCEKHDSYAVDSSC